MELSIPVQAKTQDSPRDLENQTILLENDFFNNFAYQGYTNILQETLSNENTLFLEKTIKPKLIKLIADLKSIGLEVEKNVDQLMAVLEKLNNPTLDEARTFQEPTVTLDLCKKIPDIIFSMNRYFNPFNDQKTSTVYCPDPNQAGWLRTIDSQPGALGVFIIEGADEINPHPNITGKRKNWSSEIEAYNEELKKKQRNKIEVHHISAQQFLTFVSVQKFIYKRKIDASTYTLLESKDYTSMISVGNTYDNLIILDQNFPTNKTSKLRQRRSVGNMCQ